MAFLSELVGVLAGVTPFDVRLLVLPVPGFDEHDVTLLDPGAVLHAAGDPSHPVFTVLALDADVVAAVVLGNHGEQFVAVGHSEVPTFGFFFAHTPFLGHATDKLTETCVTAVHGIFTGSPAGLSSERTIRYAMKAAAKIVVDRPIEEVWDYIADVETMDRWVIGVSETAKVNDIDGVGARYESKYTYAGTTHDIVYEVTSFEPPSRFAITAPTGPFAFDAEIELRETGQGTELTNVLDTGADSRFTAVMITVLRPLMRWMMTRQLKKELVTLKEDLEHDPTGDRGASASVAEA